MLRSDGARGPSRVQRLRGLAVLGLPARPVDARRQGGLLMGSRPTLVIEGGKNLGVVLHRDGRVRFQVLGPDPQPVPSHVVEDFDMVADRSWSLAVAGLDSIREAFDAKDQLEDAKSLVERLSEGRECYHDQAVTASGVAVCVDEKCVYAEADKLLVDDYATAAPENEDSS